MIYREHFAQLVAEALGMTPYPDTVPQDAPLPAVGYLLVSSVQPQRTLEGGITLQRHSWQVDIYAATRLQLDELSGRLSALDGFGTTHFQLVTVLDARDARDDGAITKRAIVEIQTTNRRNRA